jgi:hypothetical protein
MRGFPKGKAAAVLECGDLSPLLLLERRRLPNFDDGLASRRRHKRKSADESAQSRYSPPISGLTT